MDPVAIQILEREQNREGWVGPTMVGGRRQWADVIFSASTWPGISLCSEEKLMAVYVWVPVAPGDAQAPPPPSPSATSAAASPEISRNPSRGTWTLERLCFGPSPNLVPGFHGKLGRGERAPPLFFYLPPPPFFPSFSTCSLPAVPGVHALVYPQGAAFPEMKALDKNVANGSERGLAEANRRGWSISHISGRCYTKIWINSLQSLIELNLIPYLVTFFSSVITCH